LVGVLLLGAVLATRAGAGASANAPLKAYLAQIGVQMNAYRAALTRADHAFDPVPDRVAIARFKARSVEFKRIAARVKAIRAPQGLGAQQKKIAHALDLVASAFKGFAAARLAFLKNHKQQAAIQANTREHAKLRTAQGLEVAWARAVRSRTIKAHLVVPRWLQDFFTG
jgi:hypothetical protein